MKKILVILLFVSSLLNAQTCLQKGLSKEFNFNVKLERLKSDACKIMVTVIEKNSNKKIQTLTLKSGYIFEKDFKDCSKVRSFSTGKNKNTNHTDNDFGDFIVGDFNFDGKEDFAVKRDSGGNGGPLYCYFIQNDKAAFIKEDYLTNSVEFFPSAINKVNQTLTTLVHANAYQRCKMVYQYDLKKKKWKVISKAFING